MPYENKTKTTKEPKQYLLKIHRGNKERDKSFRITKKKCTVKAARKLQFTKFPLVKRAT